MSKKRKHPSGLPDHNPGGGDAMGEGLPITIRIGPDGRVYVHDITAALAPVVAAMNPQDAAVQERARLVQEFQGRLDTDEAPFSAERS